MVSEWEQQNQKRKGSCNRGYKGCTYRFGGRLQRAERLLGKDTASFSILRIPVAHIHAAWLHQAAAKSTVYVHLSRLGQNCQEHRFPGAGTWRCRTGMAPGAVCLAQLLTSNVSRMALIQLGGNKTKSMFHSGGSSQEFWNFLQLGLGESR